MSVHPTTHSHRPPCPNAPAIFSSLPRLVFAVMFALTFLFAWSNVDPRDLLRWLACAFTLQFHTRATHATSRTRGTDSVYEAAAGPPTLEGPPGMSTQYRAAILDFRRAWEGCSELCGTRELAWSIPAPP